MQTASTNLPEAVLASAPVSARPIFHADFGRYLAKLREERTGWTQSDAARFGQKQNPVLTRQVLLHLEAGRTKDPEPEVLRALAQLYGVEYSEIAGRFVAQRYGIDIGHRDLPRHGRSGESTPHRGGVDVTAPTRVLEDLATAKRTIREMSVAANKIAALAAKQIVAGESLRARSAQSRGGKGRRNAG
jgi:transcriptional regulator with XRE-family HTH domain